MHVEVFDLMIGSKNACVCYRFIKIDRNCLIRSFQLQNCEYVHKYISIYPTIRKQRGQLVMSLPETHANSHAKIRTAILIYIEVRQVRLSPMQETETMIRYKKILEILNQHKSLFQIDSILFLFGCVYLSCFRRCI